MKEPLYNESRDKVNRGNVLGVFAKRPRAGEVKTRLASDTSTAWAAQVASAFLLDTLTRLASVNARRFLVFSPDEAAEELAGLAGSSFNLLPQGDGDLGQRLSRFIERFTASGPVVAVGSDSPTLPTACIEQAFTDLERVDVVLGPATDGGYYLIGCRRFFPELFVGIDWSSPHVLRQTVERLPTEIRLSLLPPWYDVDSLEDWQMLVGHLAAMRRAGIDPRTSRVEALRPT